MHKTAPTPKNYLVQNANRAKVENHVLIYISNPYFPVYTLYTVK